MTKKRDYKSEYEYHATPEQKKNRAMRNAARRKMARAGKVKKGDGMDVDHTKPISKGGNNGTGLRVKPKSKNRSFPRNADNSMKTKRTKK